MDDSQRLSLAIPLYNEEEGIGELLRRVRRVLAALPGGPHEIVLVDDGSVDRTPEILAAEAERDPRVVAISLSRNFGHQAAISAALDHASGDLVVVMDGDLQDPPEAIPRLVEQCRKGYDVVYALRTKREEGWLLRLCYFLFYRLIAVFSATPLPLDAGDFALLSRRVVDVIRRSPERHRFLRGMRAWVGFRQIGIPVNREPRQAGTPKYTTSGLVRLAFDGLFAFSLVPLRAAAALGALAIAVSSVYVGYTLYAKLALEQSPKGFTALIMAITFLSGVQLLFLGVVGEYVGRVYDEVKGRPIYLVRRIIRHPSTGQPSMVER